MAQAGGSAPELQLQAGPQRPVPGRQAGPQTTEERPSSTGLRGMGSLSLTWLNTYTGLHHTRARYTLRLQDFTRGTAPRGDRVMPFCYAVLFLRTAHFFFLHAHTHTPRTHGLAIGPGAQ